MCRDSPGTPLRTRPYGKDLPALSPTAPIRTCSSVTLELEEPYVSWPIAFTGGAQSWRSSRCARPRVAAAADGPSRRHQPAHGPREQPDGRPPDHVDGPVRPDVQAVERHESRDGHTDDS